jgi:hypothetical protein
MCEVVEGGEITAGRQAGERASEQQKTVRAEIINIHQEGEEKKLIKRPRAARSFFYSQFSEAIF